MPVQKRFLLGLRYQPAFEQMISPLELSTFLLTCRYRYSFSLHFCSIYSIFFGILMTVLLFAGQSV